MAKTADEVIFESPGGGGDSAYESGGDARRVPRHHILPSYFDMYIFNSFYLLHSYHPSFLICLCFNMVSFRDQKKLGPRPDRSPLGVSFKISDEHQFTESNDTHLRL